MNTLSFAIYEDNLSRFNKTVEKFNKKCVKVGVSELVVEFGEKFVEKLLQNDGKYLFFNKQYVEVHYPDIKLDNDYIVVGKIEHYHGVGTDGDKRNMNIVSSFNNHDLSEFNFVNNRCDHCNTNRFRNKMFIIKNETESKVIGSSCLKDFVGHSVDGALLMSGINDLFVEFFAKNDECKERTGARFKTVVEMTIGCIIADHGKYHSKKMASAETNFYTTGGGVLEHWYEVTSGTKPTYTYLPEEIKVYVDNVMESVEEMIGKELDSFNQNIVTFKTIDMVETKFFNMVVGYVGYWWIMNNKIEKKEETTPSAFLGNVGEKIELSVVVDRVIESSGDYGGVIIFGKEHGTNNKFAWYTTTANDLYAYEDCLPKAKDGVFRIKASIKSVKDDEKFGKTTWITRAKVV